MDNLEPKPKTNGLAVQKESKPARRTKKRSSANLDGSKAGQSINAKPTTVASPREIAVSNATAWKAATANAMVEEMSEAAEEIIDFAIELNESVGRVLIDNINHAHEPIAGDMLKITEVE